MILNIMKNIIKYYEKPIRLENKSIGIQSYTDYLGYPTVQIDFEFVKSYANVMAIMKTTIMTNVVIMGKMNLMSLTR